MPSRPIARLPLTTTVGLVALVAPCGAPFVSGPYGTFLCGQMLALAHIAVSLQLSFAYARILSFSQGTFFALSAYAAFYLHRAGWDLLPTLIGASFGAGVLGLVVGLMVTRKKGLHTAVIGTLLVASIVSMSADSFVDVTGGEDGFSVAARCICWDCTCRRGSICSPISLPSSRSPCI